MAPPPRDIPGPCRLAPLQCAGVCGAGTGFHGNCPSEMSRLSELWELSPIYRAQTSLSGTSDNEAGTEMV